MPRLASRRACRAAAAALALLVLALPPAAAHGALAAAAGSLFEALPFVLAGTLLPTRLAFAGPLLACGCGGRLPGALSLPAVGLCWVSFGPAVTLARTAAAILAALAGFGGLRGARCRGGRSPRGGIRDRAQVGGRPGVACKPGSRPHNAVDQRLRTLQPDESPDPFVDLGRIGLAGFAGSLVAQALPATVHGLWPPVAFLAGAVAGSLSPCATAALTAAEGLRAASPAAAAGLLSSAGLVSLRAGLPVLSLRPGRPGMPRRPGRPGVALPPGRRSVKQRLRWTGGEESARHGTGMALALTIGACLWLTFRGGAGFLNPRLWILGPAGAAMAGLAFVRGSRTALAAPLLLPLALLSALALGSPPPGETVATLPLGLYPGALIDFTGTIRAGRQAVGRAAIVCCRADARLIVLPLDIGLPWRPGTWVRVRGRIRAGPDGLQATGVSAERVPQPRDPFAYL